MCREPPGAVSVPRVAVTHSTVCAACLLCVGAVPDIGDPAVCKAGGRDPFPPGAAVGEEDGVAG